MFAKIRQLRARFHDAHLVKKAPSQNIVASDGRKLGCVDQVVFSNGALRAQGWVQSCAQVTLECAYSERTAPVQSLRVDVAQELQISPDVGFKVSQGLTFHQLSHSPSVGLRFTPNLGTAEIAPVYFTFDKLWTARLKCDLLFLKCAAIIAPLAFRWIFLRKSDDRAKILRELAIGPLRIEPELNNAIFAKAPPEASAGGQLSIILPVFNALDLLPEALDRIKKNTEQTYHLTLIEDASTDESVRPFLRNWIEGNLRSISYTYLENTTNLGFIGSVNRGLSSVLSDASQFGPIVLFNSDAFVPAGWDRRLTQPFADDANIASTTPMSNNAEIMSVPVQCAITDLPAGAVDEIDAQAKMLDPLQARAVVPTGVGFCMAISRKWAAQFPLLDTAFGCGYGEEVDWCQKVRAEGGYHVGLGNLFVEHRGGASFGPAAKMALIAHNNGIVSSRYPTYDGDVRDFIISDPLILSRLVLALKWAQIRAGTTQIPVYFAHSMGGGAERYLVNCLQEDVADIGVAVVIRVGGQHRWRVEVHTAMGLTAASTQDTEVLTQLINLLPHRHFIYSCGVGDSDPMSLVEEVLTLNAGLDDRLTVLVHDFFMISPSYNLLGSDGTYQGVSPAAFEAGPVHVARRPDGESVSLPDWQNGWHRLLTAADEVTVFSQSSAEIMMQVWPDLNAVIKLRPHQLSNAISAVTPPASNAPFVLGVLGGINHAKGAGVLERLAKSRPNLSIVVIGQVDPAFKMPANVNVHGRYDPENISKMSQHYGITTWFIPSIWPETFSYTTHEAIATKLPVLAFSIGGQGDAVRDAPNGTALAVDANLTLSSEKLTASVVDYLDQFYDT